MGHWEKKDGGAIPAEISTKLDGFFRDFEGYKSKNDEALKEIKKGREDAVTKAELKRRDDALDKLKDDINTLFKRGSRPAISVPAEVAALESKANREFGAWHGGMDESKSAAERIAYKSAFDKMIRRGEKALSADEVKTLSVGSAPDGGYYVEPARADYIITSLRETSDMRSIASVMTITSNSLKIPVARDDIGYEWVGEQSTRNATTTPQVGELEIPVHELSAMPKVTQNMLDDVAFDVEGWVNDQLAYRFARGENTAFVTGNGTSRPRGITTYTTAATADLSRSFGTLEHVATGVSGDWAASNKADKLLDLLYRFHPTYRANLTWVMNRLTLGGVRKFKDGQGNYICGPRLQETMGQSPMLTEMIFGYSVKEFADMPDLAANSLSVACGDFRRGYQIIDKQGMRQLRDVYTDKPRVLLYTTKRVGGAVTDSDAIKFIKFI